MNGSYANARTGAADKLGNLASCSTSSALIAGHSIESMRRTIWAMTGLALIAAACGGDATETAAPNAAETDTTVVEEVVEDTAAATTASTTTAAPETTTTVAETTTTAPPVPTMTIDFDGLAPLGDAGVYEMWFVGADGNPVSGGTFDADAGPVVLDLPDGIPGAVELKVSIETDDDPAPSQTIVLAGAMDGIAGDRSAELTTADIADFSTASGQYILATPTDGDGPPENERSGVWWTILPRQRSLILPELGAGWEYEMWQVIDGVEVAGGKFSDTFAPDDAAPYSGPEDAPPLVGEDFLINAPAGLTFPVDLRGTETFISVEPVPDPSPDSSGIVPLSGIVPVDAEDHNALSVENVSDSRLPTATITISEG